MFGTQNEDWNHVPFPFLQPLAPLEVTILPEEFLNSITCPLTLEPFTDPVVGGDGHTYESGWTEKHLNDNNYLQ